MEPLFVYPWATAKVSENVEIANATMKTLEDVGVFVEFPELRKVALALGPGKVGAYLFPFASRSKLETISLFLTTFFLYDDTREGIGEDEIDKILRAITGEHVDLTNEPRSFIRAIAKVGEGLRGMPAPWFRGFWHGMQVYLESLNEEKQLLGALQAEGHPGVTSFLRWRRPNIGGHVLCNMVEYEMGVVLSEPWAGHALVMEIWDLWNDIMMYQNDLFSALSGRDDAKLNLSFAIARDFGLGRREAAGILMQMHDAAVRRVSALCSELTRLCDGDAQMKAMLRRQQLTFAGFARFQEEAKRWSSAVLEPPCGGEASSIMSPDDRPSQACAL